MATQGAHIDFFDANVFANSKGRLWGGRARTVPTSLDPFASPQVTSVSGGKAP